MSARQAGSSPSVTDLLAAWRKGDPGALSDLMDSIYPELLRMARGQLRGEAVNVSLDPAALVHEAYMRLVGQGARWQNRKHFYAIAARVMRRVLVDHARARQRKKRHGVQVTLGDEHARTSDRTVDILALDQALTRLESQGYERESQVVQLRYFGGLTTAEVARHLELGEATVERSWSFARTWLYRELSGRPAGPGVDPGPRA